MTDVTMRNENIELFADATLMLLMTIAVVFLMQADPLLPAMWIGASAIITWMHR